MFKNCVIMNREVLITRVYKFCEIHISKGKKIVADHFLKENVPKATIYRYIKHWEQGISTKRKPGSGRKATIMTTTNIRRLEAQVNNKSGISTRMLAKKFNCNQSHIVRTLKHKCGIRYRKKITIPERTEGQKQKIRPRCRRLLEKFSGKCFILDDESYFTFKNSDKNANAGFYTKDVNTVPEDVKTKTKKSLKRNFLYGWRFPL